MKVLYVRISEGSHAYVTDLARTSGKSIAFVVDAILAEAGRRGWRMADSPLLIVEAPVDQP